MKIYTFIAIKPGMPFFKLLRLSPFLLIFIATFSLAELRSYNTAPKPAARKTAVSAGPKRSHTPVARFKHKLRSLFDYSETFIPNNAYCSLNNGSITGAFVPGASPKSYRWATPAGTTIISNQELAGVPAGDYLLYVTDNSNVETLYKTYTVSTASALAISFGSEQVSHDQCAQSIGSIKNIQISGGVPPYTFRWTKGSQLVNTDIDIAGLSEGTYTLEVKDASPCGLATQNYAVVNRTADTFAPDVGNLLTCSGGEVTIQVNNPQTGYSYKLYDDATTAVVLDDEASGIFKVAAPVSRSYFISEYVGTCESARAEVKVTVGLTAINIPNTFTPNADGINDNWGIKGLDNYPGALVQVFTRYGQRVFESKGYDVPFDGTMKGAKLPVGVYYYVIGLNSNCNLLSGNLTILR